MSIAEEREIAALELVKAIARLDLMDEGQDREGYTDDAQETLNNLIENARSICAMKA